MAKKVTNIQVKDTLIRTMQQNGMDYGVSQILPVRKMVAIQMG